VSGRSSRKFLRKHVAVHYEPEKVKEPELREAVGRAGYTAVEV
jgi:hypothetical protein